MPQDGAFRQSAGWKMDRKKGRTLGIVCILSSAFCFAMMNMFVRLSGDLPSIEKSFFRNFIAAIIAMAAVLHGRKEMKIRRSDLPLLILRSAAGTLGVLGNYYAVDHLILSDATMLNKMSPFFTLIFSAIFLREKVSLRTIAIVIGAFAGSLFVIKPVFSNSDIAASLIGFGGGLAAGAAYTCVRALGKRGVESSLIVLFFSAFSCLVTLPYLIFRFHPIAPVQLAFLLLAGLAAAGGQFSITAAYRFAAAREISVYDYSQVLFSALFGWMIFSESPDGLSFLGYAVIILMAVLMYLRNRKAAA